MLFSVKFYLASPNLEICRVKVKGRAYTRHSSARGCGVVTPHILKVGTMWK